MIVMADARRWHVFTSIGGYIAVALVDELTSADEIREDPTEFLAWPIPLAATYMESGKSKDG